AGRGIGRGASGGGAGHGTPAPAVILNSLPWQGQLMVPFATLLQMQPTWVQTALNARSTPLAGWVTMTFWAMNTLPPPTGMSFTKPSRVPIAPPAAWPAIPEETDGAGGC